ncbi:MAG TPA: hypothetical protein VLA98_05095, partial [Solirubrobacteraceae bacterium]|nr:hypothetical protein [Solirubrobacteraceae bacterium]
MAGGRRGGEHGQGTVEHAALLLLVAAIVLAGLVAADALGARSRAGDAVRRQLARAICLAGGGAARACDADREPCVVAGDGMTAEASAGIAVLRVREGGLLSVERRSDGTVTVTVLNELGGELSASGARRMWVVAGRRLPGSRPSVGAALAATLGSGVSWTLPDAAAAGRLVSAIQGGGRLPRVLRGVPDVRLLPPGVPPPSAVSRRRELTGSLHVALEAGPVRAGVDLDARDVVSWGEDRRTGERSVVLARHAAAGLSGRGGTQSASVGVAADEEVVLVLDASGRALELVRVETADVRGSGDLPATAQPAAG